MKRWHCRPIRNYPGRYILVDCLPVVSPMQLLENDEDVPSFVIPAARDRVFVAVLEGGGLISYQRANGAFLHTLGDEAGFRSKLEHLGISI